MGDQGGTPGPANMPQTIFQILSELIEKVIN